MESTDSGATWTVLAAGSVIRNVSGGFLTFIFPDGHVYAIARNGTIGLSLAPGSTELLQFPLIGIPVGVLEVQFANNGDGWALVNQSGCRSFKSDCWSSQLHIEQTDDGGHNWYPR